MKNICTILAIVLITGCSSMGMGGGWGTTSGRSNMGTTQSSSYSMDREPVIKRNGHLSLYHGG